MAAFKYLQALTVSPDDDKALTNLAICLSNTAYAQFADIAFDEALQSNPHSEEAMYQYLVYLLDTENYEKFKKLQP